MIRKDSLAISPFFLVSHCGSAVLMIVTPFAIVDEKRVPRHEFAFPMPFIFLPIAFVLRPIRIDHHPFTRPHEPRLRILIFTIIQIT